MRYTLYFRYCDTREVLYRIAPTMYLIRKYQRLSATEALFTRQWHHVDADTYDRIADHAASLYEVLRRRGVWL
jgi:hypothetical protein